MRNIKVMAVVDLCLLTLGLFQVISGIALFISPEGPRSGQWMFLELTKHTWKDLHTYLAFTLIALTAIHVILNWNVLMRRLKILFAGRALTLNLNRRSESNPPAGRKG